MGRPWSARSLADRSGLTDRTERAALTTHCWVLDRPGSTGRSPGLLLEWRREGHAWLGLVAYVERQEQDRFRLVQRWVPAEVLKPVDQG